MPADEPRRPRVARVEPPDPRQRDSLAEDEASAFAEDELEKRAKRGAHERRERFRDHIAKAAGFVFWVFVLMGVAAIGIWFWHLLAPETWHFLTSTQISKIEIVVFSAVLASAIPALARKYI